MEVEGSGSHIQDGKGRPTHTTHFAHVDTTYLMPVLVF